MLVVGGYYVSLWCVVDGLGVILSVWFGYFMVWCFVCLWFVLLCVFNLLHGWLMWMLGVFVWYELGLAL